MANKAASDGVSNKSNELDSLITAFTSPMPNQKKILVDYEAKQRKMKQAARAARISQSANGACANSRSREEDAVTEMSHEYGELEGGMIREFTIHILQSIHFLQGLEPIPWEEVAQRQVNIKFTKRKQGIKKLLLFDLDETLAHCVRGEPECEPDVRLMITTPNGQKVWANFNIRPYTHEMLKEVNKYYEVGVFTASQGHYADVIINHIDPEKKLIQHRFYRNSCIRANDSVYLKDLRIIKNVHMKDIVLVDNAVYCFGLQLSNGIPVMPFKEDKTDREFESLTRFLVRLSSEDDVREVLKMAFSL